MKHMKNMKRSPGVLAAADRRWWRRHRRGQYKRQLSLHEPAAAGELHVLHG
jgi:hypothetical protein